MNPNPALRLFTKFTCFSTLLLIFVGGMVTSTGSGLAVPDWPLSYGTLFPPMVGGVFYEHGHRMVASFVGLLILIQCIWLWQVESRRWVKLSGVLALAMVIIQGVLGGLTVLFFLPDPISVAHGMLAQTLFLLTIFVAYSQSTERAARPEDNQNAVPILLRSTLALLMVLYLQLMLGAIMRHTGSGLAIYDFPTMGGEWWPKFDSAMLARINSWRFDHNLDPVELSNVLYHFLHRVGALGVLIMLCILNSAAHNLKLSNGVSRTIAWLDGFVLIQIALGIITVLSGKAPIITSLHVVTGAATLGLTFLLFLRASPLSIRKLIL